MAMNAMQPTECRVLIVDDEPTTRNAVSRALQLMGYGTATAADGQQALSMLDSQEYGAVLLDLRMPEVDGVEVMTRVRESWPNLQVVVLTAHASMNSAIASIRAGASDYLLKPCSIKEIESALARALRKYREQVQQRRMVKVVTEAMDLIQMSEVALPSPVRGEDLGLLRRGRVTLDKEKRVAVVELDSGERSACQLTAMEADLFSFLMENAGRVFSCQELVRRTLRYDVTEVEAEEILRPHVSRLRKKIESDPAHPSFLCTIRGRGYYFAGP